MATHDHDPTEQDDVGNGENVSTPAADMRAIRNARIVGEWISGKSFTSLGRRYGLSGTQIRRIVADATERADVNADDYLARAKADAAARRAALLEFVMARLDELTPAQALRALEVTDERLDRLHGAADASAAPAAPPPEQPEPFVVEVDDDEISDTP